MKLEKDWLIEAVYYLYPLICDGVTQSTIDTYIDYQAYDSPLIKRTIEDAIKSIKHFILECGVLQIELPKSKDIVVEIHQEIHSRIPKIKLVHQPELPK
jgi:hypothetical protein